MYCFFIETKEVFLKTLKKFLDNFNENNLKINIKIFSYYKKMYIFVSQFDT